MNTQIRNCYYTLVWVLVMVACKSNDPIASRTDLITAHAWIGVSYTSTTGLQTTIIPIPACVQDNEFTFSPDGILTLDIGELKCSADEPQTITDEWEFRSDNTELIIIIDGQEQNLMIVELTESSLKTASVRVSSGVQTTVESHFVPVTQD
ncbi:MAG: hypothetical protein RIM99_19735 [Cyclobacteriaceae bacterium]